jgi:hypothetical protein
MGTKVRAVRRNVPFGPFAFIQPAFGPELGEDINSAINVSLPTEAEIAARQVIELRARLGLRSFAALAFNAPRSCGKNRQSSSCRKARSGMSFDNPLIVPVRDCSQADVDKRNSRLRTGQRDFPGAKVRYRPWYRLRPRGLQAIDFDDIFSVGKGGIRTH